MSAWRFYLGIGGLILCGHIADSVAGMLLRELIP